MLVGTTVDLFSGVLGVKVIVAPWTDVRVCGKVYVDVAGSFVEEASSHNTSHSVPKSGP